MSSYWCGYDSFLYDNICTQDSNKCKTFYAPTAYPNIINNMNGNKASKRAFNSFVNVYIDNKLVSSSKYYN